MTETPEPTESLASLQHDGRRYELFRTTTDQSAIVRGDGGRWQIVLKATALEVKEGLLRMEEGGLVAIVEGVHKRTGRPTYGCIYTLSPDGRLLQLDYHFKPDKLLAVLERDGLRYEFSDTRGAAAGILVCRGADGVVRWWRLLSTPEIGLEDATIALVDGQLSVDAFGYHSRGGEQCRCSFRVTMGGTLTRQEPMQFLK